MVALAEYIYTLYIHIMFSAPEGEIKGMQQLGRAITIAQNTQHSQSLGCIHRAEGILGAINRCWGTRPHFG